MNVASVSAGSIQKRILFTLNPCLRWRTVRRQMKVVILCGGLGTRLREETEFRPKPMVSVGPQPILWHIMKHYARHGHKDFILCLGYKGEVIKDYFRNFLWHTHDVTLQMGPQPKIDYHDNEGIEDWTVTLLDTGQETQTGGRLRRAMKHVPDETFLFTYGDGLSDVDINASIEFHQQYGALATITAVKPAGRYGELSLKDFTITGFHEKPHQEDAYINGGFMVFNRGIINYLSGDECVLEQEPMRALSASGQLKAFCHDDFWQCMDTYREQQLLENMWSSGKAPWKTW